MCSLSIKKTQAKIEPKQKIFETPIVIFSKVNRICYLPIKWYYILKNTYIATKNTHTLIQTSNGPGLFAISIKSIVTINNHKVNVFIYKSRINFD